MTKPDAPDPRSTGSSPAAPFSAGLVRACLVLAALLLAAALAAFYSASRVSDKARHAANGAVQVTINAKSCDPDQLTVPAGRSTFEIVNKSDRAVEWEILDGVMVLEERENIAPGFRQTLSAKLAPGTYEITCGLLSNPRGKLVVTPSAAHDAEKGKLSLTAFIGALAEYQIYLAAQADAFEKAASTLQAAIAGGDLAAAQAAYGPAQAAYARIAPVSQAAFSDLDTAINAEADYFEKREQDPAFGGLHRIEYGLFAQKSVAGLAPVADKLVQDAGQLKERARGLRIMPDQLLAAAGTALGRFAGMTDQGEDRYAHTDLETLSGLVAGAEKSADVLRPIIVKVKPGAYDALDKQFAATKALIDSFATGGSYKPFDQLSADDRQKLKTALQSLIAEIAKLRDQAGVNT